MIFIISLLHENDKFVVCKLLDFLDMVLGMYLSLSGV